MAAHERKQSLLSADTRPSRPPFPVALRRVLDGGLLALVVLGVVGGAAAHLVGLGQAGDATWFLSTGLAACVLAVTIGRDLLARRAGVDVIALLAMLGAMALGELLAGAVIALMYVTGAALERFAQGRAERELAALLGRAPAYAHCYEDGRLVQRPVDEVEPEDRLLIRPGEVIPVDGLILESAATLDESALTGESRLVVRQPDEPVASGSVNAGGGFDLRATATAEASTYAGIVRLVREAQASKAPLVRLADRYALVFLPLTLGLAGLAWLWSGDPIRALAVLVVATPCPLLLAAPIAIVAGISRAARRGIIVKGGGPLEVLAGARVVLIDKTGTLTAGASRLERVEVPGEVGAEEALRLAASLEQASPHVLAAAIVRAAHDRGLTLSVPEGVEESPGNGIRGRIGGRIVSVGNAEWMAGGGALTPWAREARRRVAAAGATAVYVEVDGQLAGVLVLEDPLRAEAPRALRLLRTTGVSRLVMVTGDDPSVAQAVGAALGLDGILAERTPAEKVDAVRAERMKAPGATVMIGDGINDAPALAAADCGVAMGARGATASSEAADVVITVDRLDRFAEAIRIARRARGIAVQSVVLGMGLSLIAMVVAAAGFLPPVSGAILQEGIDVAVILNALRALQGDGPGQVRLPGWAATRLQLEQEHAHLRPLLSQVRTAADQLGRIPPAELPDRLRQLSAGLATDLLPHESLEESTVYPALARALGGSDPLAPLSATHREIFHRVRLLDRAVAAMPEAGPDPEELPDLRHVLYGLNAILELHMAQEEELYLAVAEGDSPGAAVAGALPNAEEVGR
jgi:heavy metal translocating P-type ATPase